MDNDPNGYDWREYNYASYEQFIEEKAGQSPDDWPMPKPPPYEADDEDDDA